MEQPDRAPGSSSPVNSRPADLLQQVKQRLVQNWHVPAPVSRDFTEADRPVSPPVAIVNETFARRFNGGKSPIEMKCFIQAHHS